jgi:tRNA splicing ligase
MLALQEFLHAKGIDKLQSKLKINVYRHPTLPLVGFKYNQIDSPRTHPVVRECRGIVLEDKTWKLVAKPFNRFFNVGEVPDEFAEFNWGRFTCVNKERKMAPSLSSIIMRANGI